MNKVTAVNSIVIDVHREAVWNFTQDWRKRTRWDRSVLAAEYISESPVTVHVTGAGGLRFKVTYKTSDPPRLTTLVMSELNSFWIKGGGGSWKYEELNGSTRWTQHNTLILRGGFFGMLFRPLFAWTLTRMTRRMMARAKVILENQDASFSSVGTGSGNKKPDRP